MLVLTQLECNHVISSFGRSFACANHQIISEERQFGAGNLYRELTDLDLVSFKV
jgi:hypothetical protein